MRDEKLCAVFGALVLRIRRLASHPFRVLVTRRAFTVAGSARLLFFRFMAIYPVQANRMFTFDTRYDQVLWNHFPAVVAALRQNLEYWYLLPALQVKANHHFGFSVLANTCMLVDFLSQYEAGAAQSHRDVFKDYLRMHWSAFDAPFAHAIQLGGHALTDIADVIRAGQESRYEHRANPDA